MTYKIRLNFVLARDAGIVYPDAVRSMSADSVFVIRNHENRYLTKKHKWRSGKDRHILFRSAEKDVALNELIEVNARDIMARLQLVLCELDDHNLPLVEVMAEDPPEALEEDMADQAVAEAFAKIGAKSASPDHQSGQSA